MGAQILVMILVPILLAAAAGWDLASFTIPNFLPACLIAGFVLFVPAAHLTVHAVLLHLLAGLLGFCLGFTLFAFGYIGGGDAKLFAAIALWLGFADLGGFAIAASLFGGLLTLTLLVLRQWPLPGIMARQSWIGRLHAPGAGIPYGVALAAGAFAILPHTEIFRLAAGV
jgi:prepilin peptidase CpaA